MSSMRHSCGSPPTCRHLVTSDQGFSILRDTASRTHTIGRRFAVLSLLAAALGMTGLAHASGGPVGGQVVAGSGQIQQIGNTTTILQNSKTLSLNWQSFNVAPDQTVNFLQPGSDAIAVNRIFSATPSEIYGHLNANGQVWLINPSGILFGPDAQVNVGGLVASTLDFDDSTLDSNSRRFSGAGKGSVVNRGTINAANGGYVALLGNQVSNQGTITAQLGTVALGGGSAVTLTFTGSQLVHLQVDQSTLNNLAENRQLIVADGGRVIMTAGAKDALLASVVNNTGRIQAQTVQNHNGTITLLGGMEAGQVNVGGTLDASAPNGGNGGSIETSAANFNLAGDAHITAAAPRGQAGTWLVDPTDLTIDSSAATTISDTLNGGTNVTEQTTSTGATGVGTQSSGEGDINVDAAVSWNSSATLTLQAYHGINVNQPVNGGSAGKVVMDASGANLTIASGASITGGGGITLATAANFVNNAGSAAVNAGSANWLIYSSNPTLDTTGGLTPDFIQYDAPYQTAAATSGNGFLYSVAPTLTISGLTGTVSKTYDGTNSASLAASNFITSGLIDGDAIASATGTYGSANAGSNLAVTTPGAISGFNLINSAGIPVYGYALSGSATAYIGTILQKQLAATIIGDPTKVYDGTTTATLNSSNYQLDGFVTGQGATVNQPSSVAYAGVDAGSQAVNATFTLTNFVANSGTDLANYILPASATGMGTITPAPVLLSGLLANGKVYDGTTAATLNLSNASIYGVISQDSSDVALDSSNGIGTFASANAGSNIVVNVSGFTLSGTKASDYQLIAPTNLTADIDRKALTVSGVTANDKVYDGTTVDNLNLGSATLNGVVGSDDVSLLTGSATGTFSQSDVGSNLAVTASGLALTGTAAGNYTVTEPTGLTGNITPRPLTISFNGSPTKIYDGTDAATLTQGDFTLTGFAGSEGAVVSQSPATYASANAGDGIGVTATLQPSDFTPNAGTKLSNYSFNSTVTGTGTIDPAQLTAAIVNNPSKVYDGTTTATLADNNFVLYGLIGGDSISLANTSISGNYASANAGIEGVSAALSSGDFTVGNGTLLSNYVLPTLATGFGTITPAPLAGSLVASLNKTITKVYDGTDTYLLNVSTDGGQTYTQDFVLTGFQNGDAAHVNANITGYFASKNVANNQPFEVTLNSSDFTFTSGSASNYTFPTYIFTTGSITPAPLTVSLIGNLNKVYDGSTVAQLDSSNFQINGFVSGEGATVTPTASFNYATANANNNIAISGTLTANNYTANSGTLLSNYTLATSAAGFGNITPAPLYITGVYASNKIYDTTADDTLNVAAAGLSGLVASDVGKVTLTTSTSGTFAQSDVGSGIAVTANGFSISGSAATNYTLQSIIGLAADITPKALTISGVTATDKIYDGSTSDTLDTGSAVLNGVLGSDNVTLASSGAGGTFITANVGSDLAVTAGGFTLSGAQAGDYTVVQPSGLSASITPRQLTATITGSPTKVYDGTNSATLTASDYTLTGFVSGQGASIPQSATANYVTPNAGTGLGVQSTLVTSDFVADSGTLLSNYILPASASGNNGVITPYVLNLTGMRVYDANTDAAAALFGNSGVLTGLNGDQLTLSGTGTVSSKNVGSYTGTNFALNTLALTGNGSALASNYTLQGGTDTLTITPATLTVSGTVAVDKIYDGTTAASLNGSVLNGVFSGDNVTLGNDSSGTFATKNVGNGIAVGTSMTIGGGDAGNYILQQPSGITANITPLAITVTATGTNREYDGTDNDAVTLAGTLAGDNVTINDTSATFADPNVANGKTVTVIGISLSGASAGNYTLNNTTTTTTANVTPYVLNLSGTRVYDATTGAAATLFGSDGMLTGVDGETLTLSGTGTVSSKNVGSYTGGNFALNTLALTGNGSALASNYTLEGGTDTLTITPATLTVSGTVAADKIYDGTAAASLSGSVLNGVFSGDNVTLGNDSSGTFATKNVGNGIAVGTSMTIGGGDAGNYILQQPSGITANITPLAITVTATGTNREYDGTDNDAVTLAGTLAGDNVTINDTSATFADPNVANGKTVTVIGISLSGASAGNYTLNNTTTTTTANVTPYVLNLSGTRVYDATTGAAAMLFGSDGVLTGVNGETLTLSGTGTVSSKNVGSYTSTNFALNTLALAGNGSALASNYTLQGGTDTLTITPYVLSLGGTRVYDATTGAIASLFGNNGVLTGVNGETVNLSGSGVLNSKNVGTQGFAGLGTLSLSNGSGLSSNYTLQGGTDSVVVTPYVLNLSGTRAYDATTGAVASLFGNDGVLTGVNGETVNLSGSGVLNSKNVGTQGFAGLGTLSLSNGSGLSSNYTLQGGTDSVVVTPYVLNLSGTRVYDATTGADASLFGSSGVLTGVNGETLTLGGTGTVSSKNVGTYTGTDFTLNTLSLSGNGSALASNYTLQGGTDTLTITPYTLTVTGTTVDTRAYDGSTTAALNGATLNGVFAGDNVTLGSDTAGTFASPNVGNGIAVSTSMTINGGDAGNYVLVQPNNLSGTITPYVLNLTGTRSYDATGTADADLFGSHGVLTGVNGETLTLGGAGTVSSKNVGTYTGTDFTLNTLALTGNGSALASNYTLQGGTDSLTINPAILTVSGTVAANKTYDGTTSASLSGATLNGVFAGDNVTLGGDTTGTFASPNAGNGVAVSTAMSVTGGDVGNYILQQPTGLTANIAPYILNLSGTRVYDATTDADASLFGSGGMLTGVNGETLTLSGSGTASSKNVGTYTGTDFALNTLSLTGNGSALASNYTLQGGTDTLTITPYTLTVTGTTVDTRAYDGSTTAALNGATLNGVFAGDNVTLGSDTAGTFASPNVGNGIAVSTSMTINGGDAGNYVLVQPNNLSGTITPYVLNLTGTRSYDATGTADADLFGSHGVLTGVNGETLTLGGAGTVSSKNVGTYTGTDFTLNTLALTGNGSALASNYTLQGGTDSLTINPAILTVSGTVAANKTYDGTTSASLSGATLNGVFAGDNVTLGGDTTGTFASPNAGNGVAVSTAMSVTGGDVGNYILQQPTGLTANIAPYILNLSGTRVYDATTDADASLFGSSGMLTGVNGETVDLSGSGVLVSKQVGTQSFSNLGTLTLSSGTGLASNYTLVGGVDNVVVTPLAIAISATGHDKTYDGNTTAGVTLSSAGVLAGDNVSFSNGAANFSSPNAGSNVPIVVTGITATGADAGDYAFNSTVTTGATINPYVLSLTGTRVYDASTDADASLFGNHGVLTGVNGETVQLSGASVLTSKNVGSQRAFANVGTLGLSDGTGLASNYTLIGGTDWVTITPATLAVVGTTTSNRVYDGTVLDALSGSTLSGVLGNDEVALDNDTMGLFDNAHVGNNKSVMTAMTISGADAGNYILVQPTGLVADITPRPIVVSAVGTNRMYNGQAGDAVVLNATGVLAGDQLSFVYGSANFADPYVGNNKTVTVSGITAMGTDASDYFIEDPATTTLADITSIGFEGSGVQGSWIAQLQGGLQPQAIATPYGSSDTDAVGVFTGNQKRRHRPIERNRTRSDFRSGLSLQFQNGGVRLPTDASP